MDFEKTVRDSDGGLDQRHRHARSGRVSTIRMMT
jgi:hypothetical protein